ncbi:MAG: hypothetical protein U9P72_01065 [Campylobacterota bacterium]|nr:hypothetical protein [Campylobacterota bacterium]
MKIIFIVLALCFSLFGSDLLKIHKKLVPMTLLQVKTIAKKSDKTIKIMIVVNENERLKAQTLQDMFAKKVKKFSLQTQILEENNINKLSTINFDAIYAFSLSESSYKIINNISKSNNIVTFANSHDGFKNGLLVYIDKKKKIKIYINSTTMKIVKIPFSSRFLSIVEISDE